MGNALCELNRTSVGHCGARCVVNLMGTYEGE